MNLDASYGIALIIGACAAFIHALGGALKSRADAARLEAHERVIAAQSRKAEVEQTGQHLAIHATDRRQIEELVTDMKIQMAACHDERSKLMLEISALQRRVTEIEASRLALLKEMNELRAALAR